MFKYIKILFCSLIASLMLFGSLTLADTESADVLEADPDFQRIENAADKEFEVGLEGDVVGADEVEPVELPVKEYRIPFLPRPDGLPGLDERDLEDPEDTRQFFISGFLPRVTRFMIGLVAIASFSMLLYSGVLYFTSLGESEQGDKAKTVALYAIVGLIIALLSFAAVQLIGNLPFI